MQPKILPRAAYTAGFHLLFCQFLVLLVFMPYVCHASHASYASGVAEQIALSLEGRPSLPQHQLLQYFQKYGIAPKLQSPPQTPIDKYGESVTDFAWTTFQDFTQLNPTGNIIMCPILVQLLLSQMESVAQGITKDEISKAVGYVNAQQLANFVKQTITAQQNEISSASAIFSSQHLPLNDRFVEESEANGVYVRSVDFNDLRQTSNIINTWVSSATHNRIQNLFDPSSLRGMQVLLTNTMYFRGVWKSMFTNTTDGQFQTDTQSIFTTFMNKVEKLRAGELTTTNGLELSWVELPYADNDFSMILILPSVHYNIYDLIQRLSTADLAAIIHGLDRPHKRLVYLKMPKFSVRSSSSFRDALQGLGVQYLFSTSSELPYLTKHHVPIAVSDVQQQTVLDVDEYGTVAASAASVSVVTLSLDGVPKKLIFNADRPFLSMIVNKRSKVPLFIAKISNP